MKALALLSVREPHHSRREESGETREQVGVREHRPVMLKEVLEALAPKAGEIVVDATYGQGGHSAALKQSAKITLVTIDADPDANADITGNFGDLKKLLKHAGIHSADKILLDLGWNMGQLKGRGLSFLKDEPLDMSYSDKPRSGFTAADILNTFSEEALADIFFGYGEERYARRIAAQVVRRREIAPFKTTFELVEAVRDAVPASYRHGRINPATRVFQALRIAVNDELKVLEDGLTQAWDLLNPGGRIAVISFHSTEDRIVKRLFQDFSKNGGELLFKKPLAPSRDEISRNPASRSAKLRAIAKS